MKYKTKPVVIEAYKYQAELGNNRLMNWLAQQGANVTGWLFHDGEITIPTLEGDMKVSDGDFIIRGLKGEYYPCKPDIFEMKYEETDPFAQDCGIMVYDYEEDLLEIKNPTVRDFARGIIQKALTGRVGHDSPILFTAQAREDIHTGDIFKVKANPDGTMYYADLMRAGDVRTERVDEGVG